MSITIRPMTKDDLDSMMRVENEDRARFALTEDDLQPLRIYIDHKIEPGGFLTAVLCNDLTEATGRADVYNRRKLFEYIQFLYNDAPGDCWGSREKVSAWLRGET
jgi:hypothetical protein